MAASCAEGAVAEVFGACAGGAVLTAWALHFGATPCLIGVLAALPLAVQILQIPGAWLTLRFGAKRVAVAAIASSRLIWLPMAALPFMALAREGQLTVFLGVVALGSVLGVVGNNAWTAWMASLVPAPIRGRFFGRRMIYLTLTGTAATLATGLLLDRAAGPAGTAASLGALAAIACAAGLVSVGLLRLQHDPDDEPQPPPPSTWRLLARVTADARSRPFLVYLLAWNGAVALAAGFFSFHFLANLQASFVIVAGHGVLVALVRIAAAPLWGRAVDRFGGRPVLVVCSVGIAAVPALWLLATPTFLWPLAGEALLAGALWCGHGIAAMDLTVSLASRQDRPLHLGVFAAAGGVGFAFSSVVAGWAVSSLPEHFDVRGWPWTNLHVLFALSALARAATALLALRIEEADSCSVRDMLRAAVRARPIRGASVSGRLAG
jgi:MFS family permease